MIHILSEHDQQSWPMEPSFLSQVQRGDFGLDDLDEHSVISLLTEVIEKIKKENQELNTQQAHIQVTY